MWVVLAVSGAAWMAGSVIGCAVGHHGGRPLLDSPGWLDERRRNLLAKGDRAFGRHTFIASVTLPAFVSGIFKVRFGLFVLGAMAAGAFFVGVYVGLSYLLGEEVAERIGNADATAIVSVLVIVAIGLGIRAGYHRWRGSSGRQARPTWRQERGAVTATRALRCNGGNHERHCPAARR